MFIDFPELISNCKAAQDQVKFEREFGNKLNLNKDDKLGKDENEKNNDKNLEKEDNKLESNENIDDKELRILELGCGKTFNNFKR